MNRNKQIKAVSAFLISITLVAPSVAFGEGNNNQLMIRLLDTVAKQSLKGYTRPPNVKPRMGTLEQGNKVEMSFRLRKGQKYGFAAVCDVNCSDIDLRLQDADGQVIDEDADNDETAIVVHTVEETGVYDLTVTMPSCSETECSYAIGAYKK